MNVIDWPVAIEAALIMFGAMIGSALGTIASLMAWQRRIVKKYTTTTITQEPHRHGLRRVS